MDFLGVVLLILVAGLLYFMPTFVATYRSHRNMAPIFMTNLLLGWSGLGWIAALVWSLTDNTD